MAETTETTPQWLIGMTLGQASIHEVGANGVLRDVCYVPPKSPHVRMIAQTPRMLAALKAVCNDDLSPENLAMVVEIIGAAERKGP